MVRACQPRLVLLLTALTAATGCAQWQQSPDALASSFDESVLARLESVLGEEPPSVIAGRRRPRPPQVLDFAETDQRSERQQRTTIVRRVAAEAPASDAIAQEPPLADSNLASEPLPAAWPAAPVSSSDEPVDPAPDHSTAASTPRPCDDAYCDSTCQTCPVLAFDPTCPVINACGRCRACLAGHRCTRLFTRPEPGPAPIRYRPLLPPKFLPVPTQPVLSPARPDAPDPWRGDVELGWRSQVIFPARD